MTIDARAVLERLTRRLRRGGIAAVTTTVAGFESPASRSHPNRRRPLFALRETGQPHPSPAAAVAAAAVRRAAVRVLSAGVAVMVMSSIGTAFEGLEAGTKAPAMALQTVDGRRMALTSTPEARATLLVFWATWSGRSPEVLERVQKLAARHGKQLAVIGVNVESPAMAPEDVGRAKTLATRLGLTFPIVLDRGLEAFHAYGVVAVPSSVLLRADGTVVAALASYPIAGREEFFEEVESAALGRPVARATAPRGPEPNPRAVRFYHLGRTLAARGQADQAIANLKRAIELDPTFGPPRVLLGQLDRERAVVQEAVPSASETVTTLRLSQPERDRLLGDAESVLAEALRLDPRSAPALTEMALVHRTHGDAAKARELLERAVAIDPAYSPARSQLGAALLAAGEVDRGRTELAAAIELNPLDWRLHATAAEAYAARGLRREATDAYRRGVELLWQARREAAGDGR
jgi:tetratricopeptide (TPR) repeat protein